MGGIGVEDGWIVADAVDPLTADNVAGLDGPVVALDEIPLPGWHSVSNVAAAVAVGALFGLSADAHPDGGHGLRGRRASAGAGAEHWTASGSSMTPRAPSPMRSSPRCAASRRRWCSSAAAGPRAWPSTTLAAVVAERVEAAVLIGESGPDLGEAFQAAGLGRTERAGSMDEAVRIAERIARAARRSAATRWRAATVLLSPAAASFDMYPDYAARGRDFKRAVADAIAAGSPASATDDRERTTSRRRASCPLWSAPSTALPIDGAARPGRGDKPVGRSAATATGGIRRPPTPGRTASSTAVGRPVDKVAVPRPTARELAAGNTVKGPVRDRHEADPWLLIATVALAAVGVLMIYSTAAASLSSKTSDITKAIAPSSPG